MKKRALVVVLAIACCVALGGCGGASSATPSSDSSNTTDELWQEFKSNVELEVVKRDDRVYTADGLYEIPELQGDARLAADGTYKLTADVTFLNGGVAGYVDYPQIDRVIAIEAAAAGGTEASSASAGEASASSAAQKEHDMDLSFYLDGERIDVAWEDNESVSALKALAAAAPLEISLSPYGGFEQIGSLGSSLPRDDVRMTTAPGDIVLYAGNQISVFTGSNTWEYTRLGAIEGLSGDELSALLNREGLTLSLRAE